MILSHYREQTCIRISSGFIEYFELDFISFYCCITKLISLNFVLDEDYDDILFTD